MAEQADFPGLDAEHAVEARALPPHGGQIILQGDEIAPADPSAHQPVSGGQAQQQEDPRAGVIKKATKKFIFEYQDFSNVNF